MKQQDQGGRFEDLLGAWRKHVEARHEAERRGGRDSSRDRSDGGSDWSGLNLDDWGDIGEWLGDDSRLKKRMGEMQEQMDLMAQAITMLLDRVTVLEKLAVHDEQRLADEIEKLRRPSGGRTDEGDR